MYISNFNGIDACCSFCKNSCGIFFSRVDMLKRQTPKLGIVNTFHGLSPKLIDSEKWFVYKGACF